MDRPYVAYDATNATARETAEWVCSQFQRAILTRPLHRRGLEAYPVLVFQEHHMVSSRRPVSHMPRTSW